MVTRTFTITTADVVRADLDNNTLVHDTMSFAGKIDAPAIMKLLRKRGDNTIVNVEVVNTATELRGMTVDTFIEHSEVINVGGRN